MRADPEKGPVRPWHHLPRDAKLESPESQRPQKHAPLGPEGSASQTCPLAGCLLFSPTSIFGEPGLSLMAVHSGGYGRTGWEVKHCGTLSTFPTCFRAQLSPRWV